MSSNSETKQTGFLFKAKTKEAFVIKVIGELLSNHIMYAPFQINKNGIFLTQTDTNKQQLFHLALNKENFSNYKLQKDSINFIVNASHFYKMLKTIKKKDTITIFITQEDPNCLGISVEQSGESNRITTYLRITYSLPEDITHPAGYGQPIITTSKEFQALKTLYNVSRTILLSAKNGSIRFDCDNNELYKRKVVLGNDNDDDDRNTNDEDEEQEDEQPYIQTFKNQYITGLTKCAGQSGNIQIFLPDDSRPLKIKMKAGNLGDLIIFIKSDEMINMEREDDLIPENGKDITLAELASALPDDE
jgi:hypothetical protein